MELDKIITLINAGYTKTDIDALTGSAVAAEAPAEAPAETLAEAPDTETSIKQIRVLEAEIKKLQGELQKKNRENEVFETVDKKSAYEQTMEKILRTVKPEGDK